MGAYLGAGAFPGHCGSCMQVYMHARRPLRLAFHWYMYVCILVELINYELVYQCEVYGACTYNLLLIDKFNHQVLHIVI